MSVGLFLDVDNTLTDGLIQEHMAEALQVLEEYRAIEAEFQRNPAAKADDFGRRIIELFNSRGFSDEIAAQQFETMSRTPWCEQLLNLPVTKYLVSSGPSYFVWRLADEFQIPRENVLCSEYNFDSEGRLDSCAAVSPTRKRSFVATKKVRHSVTVGLGDSPEQDGLFVSECEIGLLTVPADGFLHADSLDTVSQTVMKLQGDSPQSGRTTPAVFIGSSSEALNLAEGMLMALDSRDCHATVWNQGVFKPGKVYIESLEGALERFDFAVFILSPDDITVSREQESGSVRDNIILEMGLFMGRLGRGRCFFLHPVESEPKLPSDIDGLSFLSYDESRAKDDIRGAFGAAAAQIRSSILQHGCRVVRI